MRRGIHLTMTKPHIHFGAAIFFTFYSFCSANGVQEHALPTQLSPVATVSVLTVYPTSQVVYNLFGHTLVRLQDQAQTPPLDIVFNYGVFHFSQDFYIEYLRGNLRYFVEMTSYRAAYQHYALREDRTIHEQMLQLNHKERQALYRLLIRDMTHNSPYLYNYFTNNCSSKVWDVIAESLGSSLHAFPSCDREEKRYSYRTLFLGKFDPHYPWTKWMVALVVGLEGDKPLTYRDRMFLPEYLEEGLSCASIKRADEDIPLALPPQNIHQRTTTAHQIAWWHMLTNPLPVGVLLLCFTIGVTYQDIKRKKRCAQLDTWLSALAAMLGLLLLFFWGFTKHSSEYNYHLLWTCPLHPLAMYVLGTSYRGWAVAYFRIIFCLGAVSVGLIVFYWPLSRHILLFVPLILSLLIRVVYRIYSTTPLAPPASKNPNVRRQSALATAPAK